MLWLAMVACDPPKLSLSASNFHQKRSGGKDNCNPSSRQIPFQSHLFHSNQVSRLGRLVRSTCTSVAHTQLDKKARTRNNMRCVARHLSKRVALSRQNSFEMGKVQTGHLSRIFTVKLHSLTYHITTLDQNPAYDMILATQSSSRWHRPFLGEPC